MLSSDEIQGLFSDYSGEAINKIKEIKAKKASYDFDLLKEIMEKEKYTLTNHFKRTSPQHNTLGAMREVHLIRNANGGRWHPGHTAEVTTFGQYAKKYLRADLDL